VGNSAEAINELKLNHTYTFLIADIVMPEMDGLELIKAVKEDFPDICIIAMTGFIDQYGYLDVINAGATDFINKPYHIGELEAKIRRGIIERDTRQDLERLCMTDALSGLYNQRHFFQRLRDEIHRNQRQKGDLVLIFCDLDDLKQYNDEHGHQAGDLLIKNFGKIINSQIRQGVDSGYRYGGDEFAIILSDTDANACKIIGARIADIFEKECCASATLGYACFSQGMTPEAFMEQADKDLYRTKRQKKHQKQANDTQTAHDQYPSKSSISSS
jgi:diguanylate cyclase (GGDEF)-like protein